MLFMDLPLKKQIWYPNMRWNLRTIFLAYFGFNLLKIYFTLLFFQPDETVFCSGDGWYFRKPFQICKVAWCHLAKGFNFIATEFLFVFWCKMGDAKVKTCQNLKFKQFFLVYFALDWIDFWIVPKFNLLQAQCHERAIHFQFWTKFGGQTEGSI